MGSRWGRSKKRKQARQIEALEYSLRSAQNEVDTLKRQLHIIHKEISRRVSKYSALLPVGTIPRKFPFPGRTITLGAEHYDIESEMTNQILYALRLKVITDKLQGGVYVSVYHASDCTHTLYLSEEALDFHEARQATENYLAKQLVESMTCQREKEGYQGVPPEKSLYAQ